MLTDIRHSRTRQIGIVDTRTPLIVPSFSSRGFPQVGHIYDELRGHLFGVCLISASDISEGLIPSDFTNDANVVVVDSGRYEQDESAFGYSECSIPPSTSEWSRSAYHSTIGTRLKEVANRIVVNYDRCAEIAAQIASADEDFAHAPRAAKDFLIKPELPGQLVNVAKLRRFTSDLVSYEVIGVTARELGDSLADRCRSIVMMRDTLDEAGLDSPIHVFGAIRPCEVLAYFFCGADIFDGLSWLKLALRNDRNLHIEEVAFEEFNWNLPDDELKYEERAANLRFLFRLQEDLQAYALHGEVCALVEKYPVAAKAVRVARISGADI